MIQVFLFFALIIAALAVTFALQNTAVVTVSFLVWSFTGSLALVLFVALAAGALVGYLVMMPSVLRGRIKTASQRRRLGALENSLAEHKQRLDEMQKPLSPPSTAMVPQSRAESPPERASTPKEE